MNEIIQENQKKWRYDLWGKRSTGNVFQWCCCALSSWNKTRINEAIKRNINRFPESFCFQLTNDEIDKLSLRSQFAILNKNMNMRGQHLKYLPYVLTEQG